MEAFMGTVMPVAFNFAPRGWAFCNGQLIPIQQNSAMFALLGVAYGGDGVNTFALPDLRGRVVVGSQANGPGIDPVVQGQKAGTSNATVNASGSATVKLDASSLPAHSHTANSLTAVTTIDVSTGITGVLTPAAGSVLSATAGGASSAAIYAPSASAPVALGGVASKVTGSTDSAGTGAPVAVPVQTTALVPLMQPYLGLNYIIAMEGIFPARN